MATAIRMWYVAECFWPGVQEEELRELDRRIAAAASASDGGMARVRYLGRLVVLEDEVVLLLFNGPLESVHDVTERAGVPFERVLRVSHALWLNGITDEEVGE